MPTQKRTTNTERAGWTPFERAGRQPLMLGLFLPHQQGAWSPSKAPRKTSWSFDYNAKCAIKADKLGFDLVFALAQWMGKGGYGGDINFRENAIDPFIASAGLAPLTKNVLLIATVHILYGWHPLHLAKYGAVVEITDWLAEMVPTTVHARTYTRAWRGRLRPSAADTLLMPRATHHKRLRGARSPAQ